jgi:hypothetical protein
MFNKMFSNSDVWFLIMYDVARHSEKQKLKTVFWTRIDLR